MRVLVTATVCLSFLKCLFFPFHSLPSQTPLCNLRVFYIWPELLISAALSLLYIWKWWTIPWHKTKLTAQLLCNKSAALEVLRTIDYVQNSFCVYAISLMHLKSLRLSPKPTWGRSKFSHKAAYSFCQLISTEMGYLVWYCDVENFPSLAVIWERPVSLSSRWYNFSLVYCPRPRWPGRARRMLSLRPVLRGHKGNQCVDLLGYFRR